MGFFLATSVGESRAEVFSLKKNKPTHRSCFPNSCFPLLFFTSWGITAQLKFTVFYGPKSMKERCGAPLLGLAKSIYYKIMVSSSTGLTMPTTHFRTTACFFFVPLGMVPQYKNWRVKIFHDQICTTFSENKILKLVQRVYMFILTFAVQNFPFKRVLIAWGIQMGPPPHPAKKKH